MEFHGCGLRNHVIGHLIVGEPVYRVPEKDGAGFETSTDFLDPDIIKSHPSRFVRTQPAWLHSFPKVIRAHVFDAVVLAQVSSGSKNHISEQGYTTYVVTGFTDHRPFIANPQRWRALASTEPVGGRLAYLLRIKNMMVGQQRNNRVGRTNANQYPTYFSA